MYVFSFKEKRGCTPNPCKHGGTCTYSGGNAILCKCNQSRYTGDLCNTLIIDVPKIPAMIVNSPTTISLSAWPDRMLTLSITADSGVDVIPSSVMFTDTLTSRNITVKATDQGLHKLEFSINDPTIDYKLIPPAIVLATKKQGCSRSRGSILDPGCCQANETELGLNFQCPSSGDVILRSTCGWQTTSAPSSGGVIFTSNNDFNMPIAITGVTFQSSHDYIQLNGINFKDTCTACNTNGGSSHSCTTAYTTVKKVQCYLHHDSLASTYLQTATSVIPKWLKISTSKSNRSYDLHSYMVELVHWESLNKIQECNFMTKTSKGLHSVLIYSGSLNVEINKVKKEMQPGTFPICFAVNICEADKTSFYFNIPDHAQTFLESFKFMQNLKRDDWIVKFQSIAMSSSEMTTVAHQVTQQRYWNGISFVLSRQPKIHMLASMFFSKIILSRRNAITADLAFSGDMYLSHDNFDQVSCNNAL